MNKRFTTRLMAAFAVATLLTAGANAQILTDYVIQTSAGQSVDTVTVNSTTRLYVYPDMIYSPSYNRTTNAGLGANERWTWSGGVTKAAANENWIEQTWAATGTVIVNVAESNSAVSCPGSTSTINVQVIATPTVTFTATNATPVFGSAGSPFTFCENDPRLGTDNVQAAFTSGISGNPSYQIQYAITVDTSSDGGATWSNIAARTQTYSGAAGTQQTSNTTTSNLTAPTSGFVALPNGGGLQRPTRFTYTINGVNDRISRKSNYLTNSTRTATAWTWYDTAAETVVIIVNPTPVTGPIYHISNMWAN
jgi:hypothetical protein